MSRNHQVLVDSSVWIDFFRMGTDDRLETMVQEDLICTNELILTELIPPLERLKQNDLIKSLLSLPSLDLDIDWSIIRKYQLINITNGVNKVGIPDLIILQQVIDQQLTLFTYDKHFKLMQNYLSFDLMQ
jgi:predicted nucleic acid-binding protein